VCRYTERKESSLLFKLLGENDSHKEPDYGENEFEDRALQRRRKVCFNILQCVAVRCRVLQCVTLCVYENEFGDRALQRRH